MIPYDFAARDRAGKARREEVGQIMTSRKGEKMQEAEEEKRGHPWKRCVLQCRKAVRVDACMKHGFTS